MFGSTSQWGDTKCEIGYNIVITHKQTTKILSSEQPLKIRTGSVWMLDDLFEICIWLSSHLESCAYTVFCVVLRMSTVLKGYIYLF